MSDLAELIHNPEFRQRLMANPEAGIREAGVDLPDDVKLLVHEDSANEVHLVLGSSTEGMPEIVHQLFTRAQQDPAFKARLIDDPASAARAEFGFSFPPEIKICVHEDTAGEIHLVLPPAQSSDGEIPDFQLEAVAGGFGGFSIDRLRNRDYAEIAHRITANVIRDSRRGLGHKAWANRR